MVLTWALNLIWNTPRFIIYLFIDKYFLRIVHIKSHMFVLSFSPLPFHLTRPEGLLSLDSMYPVLTSPLAAGVTSEFSVCFLHLQRGIMSVGERADISEIT